MAHALNLTLKLKQDPESQHALQVLKESFGTVIQPLIDNALRESQIVHFARVLVIDDLYIQVLTEYDGDKQEYTEFFRLKLPQVFKAVFGLAVGAPPWDQMDKQAFYEFSKSKNISSIGNGVSDPGLQLKPEDGYLFSAYGQKTVKEILPKL